MQHVPFYDPKKTYDENFDKGPFGNFADKKKYKNKGNPMYEIFGNKVYLPFGIAAGPLLNGKFAKAALDKGFDIVVYKTVRSQKYPCSPWPNILKVKINGNLTLKKAEKGIIAEKVFSKALAITNSFGVPSQNPNFWQKDLKDTVMYAKKGQIVIGSFQGTISGNRTAYIQDFVKTAKKVKQTGVKILEVNLSCPNEGNAHLLCFDIQTTKRIVMEIRKEIKDTPLIIKIAYFTDKNQLKNLIKEVGPLVEGIAAINTIPAKIFNRKGQQALPGGPERIRAGVCGKPIHWAGLQMVRELKKLKIMFHLSYVIFATGGVITPNDYQSYIKTGANVVMSATGAMWNPYLAQEIKQNL